MAKALSSMRLPRSVFAILVFGISAWQASSLERSAHAQAQLSDAEKKSAARSLFQQGVKEQDAGRPAEALALFQKAEKLFDAPTHLLHIAQCEVLLGKLVEAAETYETLKRVNLAPGAPEVFVQAKAQAEAELPGVRARIPNLKIDLSPKPESLRNFQLVVNDVLLPVELVGVARPVNPGAARIVARADGYAATTLEVTVKEKETRSVGLSLTPGQSMPVVVPVQPGAQPYPQQYPPQYPQYPPQYPAGPSDPRPAEPPKVTSNSGFIAGVHVGALGRVSERLGANDGTFAIAGGGDFMFRFAKVILVGATVQVGSSEGGTSYLGAARFSFLTHPDKFAFTAGILAGLRGFGRGEPGGTFGGTLGFSIPVGVHFRIDPRLDLTATKVGSEFIPLVFFGVGGAFNHNFAPKPATQ